MGKAKNWSAEELDFLQEKWGTLSIKAIAKQLGRSVEGVKIKAGRMKLGDNRFCLDGITLNQLSFALNTSYSILKNWVKKYDFPARPRVLAITEKVLVVRYEDFWKWAEIHKHLLNFARLEPSILGPEPEWAKEKRKFDMVNFNKITSRPWSVEDDLKLRSMVNAYRFSYTEIAKELRRTEAAVKRRLHDLGIKARPIKADNHIKWTPEEERLLVELFNKGCGYNTLSERIGKSELAIRGKLERLGYRFRNELLSSQVR